MIYYLYRYGLRLGLLVITIVSLWDVMKYGFGCIGVFWQYSIGWKGVLLIWLSLGLILGSRWSEKKVKAGSMWNYRYIPEGVTPK